MTRFVSAARTNVIALALSLVTGCDLGIGSEPGVPPCLPGHSRSDDACLVSQAQLAIDGAHEDWIALDEMPLGANEQPRAPTAAQAAVECTTSFACQLFIHVRAAPLEPDTRARIELRATPQRPTTETNVLTFDGTTSTFVKNGVRIDELGPYHRVALTADGYELSIPIGYLALRGAALVRPTVEQRDREMWTELVDVDPVRVCWLAYPLEDSAARPVTDDPCDVAAIAEER